MSGGLIIRNNMGVINRSMHLNPGKSKINFVVSMALILGLHFWQMKQAKVATNQCLLIILIHCN